VFEFFWHLAFCVFFYERESKKREEKREREEQEHSKQPTAQHHITFLTSQSQSKQATSRVMIGVMKKKSEQ
jgi:large-conductance mechanosensitive channel